MRIHTVKSGDTIWKIARQYSTPAPKIIEANGLDDPDRLFIGQKLMIFTPTRTYTVKGGDTLEKIAMRFGVTKESMYAGNPALMGEDKIYPGQILAIKYDMPLYGSGVANGYYYRGCKQEKLKMCIPYLTYINFASHIWARNKLTRIFNYDKELDFVLGTGRFPIMRIYSECCADEFEKNAETFKKLTVKCAKDEGFSGITLALSPLMQDHEFFRSFLLSLKKEMMQNDLLLFIEINANGNISNLGEISDIADICILNYQKCPLEPIPSFENGEKEILYKFAECAEGQKTLLDMNSLAYFDKKEAEIQEAISIASKCGSPVLFDEEKLICSFKYKKYSRGIGKEVEICYESAENEKAKLDLIGELGYLGVSFDIGKVVPSTLLLFHTSFSTGRASIFN